MSCRSAPAPRVRHNTRVPHRSRPRRLQIDTGASHIFLSYASADRHRAETVARALNEAGIRVWMDRSDISGGDFWATEIANAIERCTLLAVVCSPASMQSRNVRQELQLAWDFDRPLLPLMLEPVTFPSEIAYFLQGRQWIEINSSSEPEWAAQVLSIMRSLTLSPLLERAESVRSGGVEALGRPTAFERIPSPPSPLIGRTTELQLMCDMLRDDPTRIVTLTGPGGVGKTRLALEVARMLHAADGRSTAFVDLAPIADPALVPPAIAAAAGVNELGQRPLLDILADRMRNMPWLLLLDNAEHLLAIAPFVADMLQTCPSLKFLVTSRQPLRLRGEHEFHLDPLPVPGPGDGNRIDRLESNDAVRLFTSRAQEIRAEFGLSETNAADVAEICRQLDGLPLAIELAAPRVRLMTPATLRARLQDRLGVLTGGSRDAPGRQQTLRRTIEWSYDLLDPGEQQLLAELSVFSGGFDLDGAESVAGDAAGLFEGVSSLLEKSLLQRREMVDSEPRFRMLESIRDFGLERLTEAGMEDAVRQRHFDYYLQLAELLERRSIDCTEPDWYLSSIAQWDLELDNVRVAWRWCQQRGDFAGALRLISSLGLLWAIRPYAAEVSSALAAGLRDASDIPLSVRVMPETLISNLSGLLGDFESAFAAGERGLQAALELNDPELIGRAYFFLGALWEISGNCELSAENHRQAVSWLQETPGGLHYALVMGELGDRLLTCGSIADAIPLLDEALALDRANGYGFGIAIALGQRAHAARLEGDWPLAIRLFQESIEVATSMSDDRRVLGALIGLAGVAHAMGKSELAATLIGATDAARLARGVSRVIAHPLHNVQILADVQAALGEPRYSDLVAAGRAIAFQRALALAQTELTGQVAVPSKEPVERLLP